MALLTVLMQATKAASTGLAQAGGAIGAGIAAIAAGIGVGNIGKTRWNPSPVSLKLLTTSVLT